MRNIVEAAGFAGRERGCCSTGWDVHSTESRTAVISVKTAPHRAMYTAMILEAATKAHCIITPDNVNYVW